MQESTTSKKRLLKISTRFKRDLKKSLPLYVLLICPIVWYVLFCYMPMFGLVMAFKNFKLSQGIMGSEWLDNPFEHFITFLSDKVVFWQVFKNTFIIGSVTTVITFTAPILLALFFNELRTGKYKKCLQTVSYMPYFVSTVALVNIFLFMIGFENGVVNNLLEGLGKDRINFISEPKYFLALYIIICLWRGLGWGTIIYTAAMAGIDTQLYDAANIEGAGRFQKIWHITLPTIKPTIVIMMILALPGFLGADFETILLLQTDNNMIVSDVISTYIYRRGITSGARQYSYTTAIGMFMSVINLMIIFIANFICKKIADIGLF